MYPSKLNYVTTYFTNVFEATVNGGVASAFSNTLCGSYYNDQVVLGYSGTTPTWYGVGTFPIVVRIARRVAPGASRVHDPRKNKTKHNAELPPVECAALLSGRGAGLGSASLQLLRPASAPRLCS